LQNAPFAEALPTDSKQKELKEQTSSVKKNIFMFAPNIVTS
jgi:hypothetical protein